MPSNLTVQGMGGHLLYCTGYHIVHVYSINFVFIVVPGFYETSDSNVGFNPFLRNWRTGTWLWTVVQHGLHENLLAHWQACLGDLTACSRARSWEQYHISCLEVFEWSLVTILQLPGTFIATRASMLVVFSTTSVLATGSLENYDRAH